MTETDEQLRQEIIDHAADLTIEVQKRPPTKEGEPTYTYCLKTKSTEERPLGLVICSGEWTGYFPRQAEESARAFIREAVEWWRTRPGDEVRPLPNFPHIDGVYNVFGLNKLAMGCYLTAKAHGFWPEEGRNIGELCALLHSEVSELFEAWREGRLDKPCDKPIPLSAAEEEIADILIRTLDMAYAMGMDANEVVRIKHTYNQTRPHRHGGKKA